MKQLLACAILVIGFLNYIGLLVGALLAVPVASVFPHPLRLRVVPFLGVLNGVASIFSALVLFWLFGLTSGLAVPVVTAVWISLYFRFYHQSRIEWLSYLAGIIIGWIMLKHLFQNA
jgi:ABC-type Mn2+/Zn2+ transport system permease subunit